MDSNAEQQEDFRFGLEVFRSRLENMRFRQVRFWSRQLLTVYQRILFLVMAHPEYLRFRTSSLTTLSESWWRRPGNVLDVVEDLWSQLEDLWYQRDFSSRQLVRVGQRIISFLTSHPEYLSSPTSSQTNPTLRIQERSKTRIRALLAGISNDLVELELQANFVDVDYLDAQGLDESVEHLAEADGSRSGETRPPSSYTTPTTRIHERIRAQIAGISNDLEELELQANFLDVDYLGHDGLVEHLVEADGLRKGAPPAAVSVVKSLPRVVIKDHEQIDSLTCAICKDTLFVGSVVNQLPCSHVYHPSCIFPWLSSRNTCPLCRYELPTDDQEYEGRKWWSGNESMIREIQQRNMYEGSSSDVIDDAEAREPHEFGHGRTEQGEVSGSGTRTADPQELDHGRTEQGEVMRMSRSDTRTTQRRWFFQALAVQLVSFGGIALTLWLGNQLTEQRRSRFSSQPGF